MFNTTKSIPIEIKALKFFIFSNGFSFDINAGVNTITQPNMTNIVGIKNQFPLEYMQHTPKSRISARSIESGTKTSLCFLISFGRLVNVKDKSRAEKTIQNQVKDLLIARSQIKHGISAKAYAM